MANPTSPSGYSLGHSASEVQRLVNQAELYRPLTERVFRTAGIRPGMRVLDVGCGAGDVSFLVAALVGDTGSVLGIDVAPAAVDVASSRAEALRLPNVRFVCTGLDALELETDVDAVVGRMLLMHRPDPVLAVRQAAAPVRKGGLVVFQELDFSLRVASSWPVVALFEKCISWLIEGEECSGVHMDIGKKLDQIFTAAGLPAPQMQFERIVGSEHTRTYVGLMVDVVRTLMPRIEAFGIASSSDIGIDTLATRIQAEIDAADAIAITAPLVGAWSVKP
jgi:ubiquinone/menaquinone biosynthesis C-methylase UbiE